MLLPLASVLSGLILYLAFPPFHFPILAWFAMVPLLLAITGSRPFTSFLYAFIFGVVFYTGIFYWIFDIQKYNILHHAILGIYLCPLTGGFGMVISYLARKRNISTALWAAPFLWVAQEFIRSNLDFLALPWGLLAHSQYQQPLIIQIAGFTGSYGISFLIVLVNSSITAAIYSLLIKFRTPQQTGIKSGLLPGSPVLILAASVFLLLTLLYGYIETTRSISGRKINITVVQGNIEQSMKWDEKFAPEIMKIYSSLTMKAAGQKPDLIVWPETATPRAINRDRKLYDRVKHIATSANISLLLGSAQVQKFKVEGSQVKNLKYLNSAYLISPDTNRKKDRRYDKIRLLPFGEYLPYKESIPWSYIGVPEVDYYLPGQEFTIFDLNDYRFGVTVCWENIFPDIVSGFVKKGAQFIINLTNEAWFGESAAPYQFLSMSVFRAVENKIFIIRCANTGISCFIDPHGRIVKRLEDESGKDIFIRGILNGSIVPRKSNTLYTQWGDWFAWLSILGLFIILLQSVLRKQKPHSSL